MPFDGDPNWWDGERPKRSGLLGCLVVTPLRGPRGGRSRPIRWLLEEYTASGWRSVLCFECRGGVADAQRSGVALMRVSAA